MISTMSPAHRAIALLASVDESSAAYQAGEAIGRWLVLLVLLPLAIWGLVKCVRIMRRPATNHWCVISLALFVFGVASLLVVGQQAERSESAMFIAGLLAVGSLVLFGGGIIIGIIGLIDYASHHGQYVQGRKQAVWGIVLNSLVVLLFVVGIGVAAMRAEAGSSGPVTGGSGFLGEPGERLEFEALNFAVRHPGDPWIGIDIRKVNPVATVGFRDPESQRFLFVIAENGGPGVDLETGGLAEIAKSNLRAAATEVEFEDREPVTVGGIEFVGYEARAVLPSSPDATQLLYAGSRNGWFYQVILTGESAGLEADRAALRAFVDGFELMESERLAPGELTPAPTRFVDEGYGIEVDLAGLEGWYVWEDLEADFPEAVYGALYRHLGGLVVVPVHLGELDPDLDALTSGLLATANFTYPSDEIRVVESLGDGESGYEISAVGGEDEAYAYRMTVLRRGDFGYLIHRWITRAAVERFEELDPLVERIELSGSAPAPRLEAMSPRRRATRALILNKIGLEYSRRDAYGRARSCFVAAFEATPSDAQMLLNRLDGDYRLGDWQLGLDALAAADDLPPTPELHAMEAVLLAGAGRPGEALAAYRRALDGDFDHDGYLLDTINELVERDHEVEAIALAEAQLERFPSAKVRRWHATLFERKGDYERAIELFRRYLDEDGFDAAMARELADSYLGAERYNEARETAADLLRKGHHGAESWLLMARSEMGLGWYREAKDTLEDALSDHPGDADLEQALTEVSSRLGEGRNSNVKRPIEAVAVPAGLAAVLDGIGADEPEVEGRFPYSILRESAGVAFDPGRDLRTTLRKRVAIHSSEGVDFWSSLRFTFDSVAERVFVHRAVVTDGDGRVLGEADVADCYVTDDRSGGEASDDRALHVPVPGLRVGSVLEFAISWETLAPPKSFPFRSRTFGSGVPTGVEAFFVRAPLERVKVRTSGGVIARGDGESERFWHVAAPSLWPEESYRPNYSEFLPTLWLGDAESSWESEGREYLKEIGERLEPSESVREVARRVVGDAEDPREKVERLADHVQKTLRYEAIEFGPRAWMPRSVEEVLANRYGDCKDHSLLLWQLLRAAEIEAHLALVRIGAPIHPEIESTHQFNHMIVHVPGLRASPFLDATDKHHHLAADGPPLGLAERHCLVLDPDGPRLVKTGPNPPGSASWKIHREVEVDADGAMTLEERLEVRGIGASWVRGWLAPKSEREREIAVQQFLDDDARIHVESLELENLENPRQPLKMKIGYGVDAPVPPPESGRLRLDLPIQWEGHYLDVPYYRERAAPVRVTVPMRFEGSLRLRLPEGYRLSAATKMLAREVEDDFGRFGLAFEESSGEAGARELRYWIEAEAGDWPARRWMELDRARTAAAAVLGGEWIAVAGEAGEGGDGEREGEEGLEE